MTENPRDSVEESESNTEQPSLPADAPSNDAPPPPDDSRAPSADEELTGEPELDKRLSEPVLKGNVGIETAQVWMSAFLIVIVGVIAYSNVLNSPFNVEDQRVLVNNEALHSWTNFPDAVHAQPDSPLAVLSYAKIWYLAPASPAAQRVVNIAIHLLNGVLLYLLCRRLLKRRVPEPVAMLAGLFLVLHPAASESINIVAGRAGLLVTFFSLASMLLFLRAADHPKHSALALLGLSAIALALAWAAGYAAALVPFLVLLTDLSLHGRTVFRRLPAHGFIWGVLAVLVIVSHWGHLPASALPDDTIPTSNAAKASVVTNGLLLAFNPTLLSADHDIPPVIDTSSYGERRSRITLAVSFLGVLTLMGLVLLARRIPSGISMLWAVAGLALLAWQVSLENPFTERSVYFALCGALAIVPWLVSLVLSIPPARAMAGIAAAILLVVCGTGVYMRNRVWHSVIAVWEDAETKVPDSPWPYRRIGALNFDDAVAALRNAAELSRNKEAPAAAAQREDAQRYLNAAEATLRQALEIEPNHAETLNRLGATLQMLGKLDDAYEPMLAALRLDPMNLQYTLNLASLLETRSAVENDMNDRLHAIDYFRRAEKLGALPPEMRVAYAANLASIGNLEMAERELAAVVGSDTKSPAAGQLRQVQTSLKMLRDIEAKARDMVSKEPTAKDTVRTQIQVFMIRGQILQATYLLDQFIQRYPDDLDGWLLMGVARAIVNDQERFTKEWGTPPAVPEGNAPAWMQLAQRCAANSHWNAARHYLEFAASNGTEISLPVVQLAAIAASLKQPQLEVRLLEEACAAYPQSPVPWLRLCDLAVANKNIETARKYLTEAARRNADPAEIDKRRQQVGAPATEQEKPKFDTIVR
ncbi:MAG: hypothetical protein K1Y02_18190 [Candidatus Hydrogenedentes bacterium]|nr:hypothetical protein [Candidatus Hydrogenedentota bacterium]